MKEVVRIQHVLRRRKRPHYYSDKGFKDTIVNRTRPSTNTGLFQTMFTVPISFR